MLDVTKNILLTLKGICMNFSLELIFLVTSKQPHKIVQILMGHPVHCMFKEWSKPTIIIQTHEIFCNLKPREVEQGICLTVKGVWMGFIKEFLTWLGPMWFPQGFPRLEMKKKSNLSSNLSRFIYLAIALVQCWLIHTKTVAENWDVKRHLMELFWPI